MNKNISAVLFSILLIALQLQCTELMQPNESITYAEGVSSLEQDVALNSCEQETTPLPDRNTIIVNGPISSLILDHLYNPFPNAKFISSLETPNTIKTVLFYVPVSLLDDITEKSNFKEMQTILQNMVSQPTQEEYMNALGKLAVFNQEALGKFLPVELQQEGIDLWVQALALLKKQNSYSDVEFIEQYIALMIDTGTASLNHARYYFKGTELKLPSVDVYISLMNKVANIDKLPCFITPTIVIGVKKFLETFNISEPMIHSYIQAGLFTVAPDIANILIPTYVDDYAIFCKLIFSKFIRGIMAKNLGSTFAEYAQKRKSELDYLIYKNW